jgi:hypothetical protein
MTVFGEVLLNCLQGKAAESTEEYRDGRRLWRVSVNSLNAALEREFDDVEARENVAQSYVLGGSVKNATICFLDNPPPTKALVFDERGRQATRPGVHILIAGVSAYPHGVGGTADTARINLGVGQLSAAATSAFRIYRWILANQHRLMLPLSTIRILLSPAKPEIEREPALAEVGDRCTLQNFLAAAGEWREDAATSKENMTLFYFAGHGAQRTKGDSVLLLEDFGEAVGGPLRNAVDVDNINFGMSPSTSRKNIARTQLFFIDACRVRPDAFKSYRLMHTTAVFEIDERETDNRHAPIFHAATSGSVAYGIAGQQTAFSRVLLDSLDGPATKPDEKTKSRLIVSVNSLDKALQDGMQAWNSDYKVEQEYSLEGIAKDRVIFAWDVDR